MVSAPAISGRLLEQEGPATLPLEAFALNAPGAGVNLGKQSAPGTGLGPARKIRRGP